MKRLGKVSLLLLVAGCLGACNEEPIQSVQAEEPISLNDVMVPASAQPSKKEVMKKQTHTVSLSVPDGTWSLGIKEVIETDSEVAIIAELSKAEGMMGIQMIMQLNAAVEFETDKPVKTYILGKKWAWENTEGYEFIEDATKISGRAVEYVVVDSKQTM